MGSLAPETRVELRLRELAVAALLLGALVAWIFHEPLMGLRSAAFSTADLLQNVPLLQLESGIRPRNALLSDPVVQFLPWHDFAQRELSAGRWPLWNPQNGCGTPLWANFQSAIASPASLPFRVLEPKLALLASALAKAWFAGMALFVFLRRITLRPVAALFGAASFVTCGFNMLLISYPHSTVLACLPAALFCAETILQRARDAGGAVPRGWSAALIATLVAMAYAGHPEVLFFAGITLAAYVATRLIAQAWHARRRSPRETLRTAATLVGIALASLALAAPLLLPFGEYVSLGSRTLELHAAPFPPLDSSTWPRYLFPSFLGSVIDGQNLGAELPPPNYHIANLAYAGSTVMLLAALALRRALRSSMTAPFAALAVLWPAWAHDLFGCARWLGALLHLNWVPNFVSQGPWLVALAVLAGSAVDALLAHEPRRSWLRAASIVALAGAVLAFAWTSARETAATAVRELAPAAELVEAAEGHVVWMSAAALLGILGVAAAWIARSKLRRGLALGALVIAFGVQNPGFWSHYQVACEQRFLVPRAAGIDTLRSHVGSGRVLDLSRAALPPNVNLHYGIHLVTSYDALGVGEYDGLLQSLLDPRTNWQAIASASPRDLELLGVEYVVLDEALDTRRTTVADARERVAWRGDASALQEVARMGRAVLYRYVPARGRAWLVARALFAGDMRSARGRVSLPRFEPYETVVLGPDVPPGFVAREQRRTRRQDERDASAEGPASPDGVVTCTLEVPGRSKYTVEQSAAQYLVLAQTRYPGWSASIDGAPSALLQANAAFVALDVPAGRHEIELVYRPASFRWGLIIGAIGCALALLCVWSGGRPTRSRCA